MDAPSDDAPPDALADGIPDAICSTQELPDRRLAAIGPFADRSGFAPISSANPSLGSCFTATSIPVVPTNGESTSIGLLAVDRSRG